MIYGILVYDRGQLRFSEAFRNIPLDEAEFAFSKWEDRSQFRQHAVYAIDVRPMPAEDHSDSQAVIYES